MSRQVVDLETEAEAAAEPPRPSPQVTFAIRHCSHIVRPPALVDLQPAFLREEWAVGALTVRVHPQPFRQRPSAAVRPQQPVGAWSAPGRVRRAVRVWCRSLRCCSALLLRSQIVLDALGLDLLVLDLRLVKFFAD